MKPPSFKRHRFPADVTRHAVWLYFRFNLSLRDVEELVAQGGIEASYETIRCWTKTFAPLIARRLKKRWPAPSPRWHLDEMVCWIGGRRMYLWRAVDDEDEVLRELNLAHVHRPGRLQENNRVENSHLPIRRRERQQQGFKSQATAQRFLTADAAI